jgi:hypothetical protein
MIAAASLAVVAVPSAALAAGPETRPAPQSATRPAPNAIPRLEAESLARKRSIGGMTLDGWWGTLAMMACLLAPVIGWCVPWRSLRILLALLVAGPAWFAGGLVGSSIDGFLPMMGACCVGAIFWPITTIALSERFHHIRETRKRME